MKKVTYVVPEFIQKRWSTRALLLLGPSDLANMLKQVQEAEAGNSARHQQAKIDQQQARIYWRHLHPRKAYPSELNGVLRPPTLMATWQSLIVRRNAAIRAAQRAQDEQREGFIERMETGRVVAMRKREAAIRQMINQAARQRGIKLTQRSVDQRLAELLNEVTQGQRG